MTLVTRAFRKLRRAGNRTRSSAAARAFTGFDLSKNKRPGLSAGFQSSAAAEARTVLLTNSTTSVRGSRQDRARRDQNLRRWRLVAERRVRPNLVVQQHL